VRILICGQTIELPESQLSDEQIRAMFSPYYPDIAVAELVREEQENLVKVVKRAGNKGGSEKIATMLLEAAHYLNPSMALALRLRYAEIQKILTLEMLISIQALLENVESRASDDNKLIEAAAKQLQEAGAVPSAVTLLL